MIENIGSRKTDRVVATNWLQRDQVREAIRELTFSFSCMSPLVTPPGSNQRRVFELAVKGFRHDVSYILDSLDRLLEEKP